MKHVAIALAMLPACVAALGADEKPWPISDLLLKYSAYNSDLIAVGEIEEEPPMVVQHKSPVAGTQWGTYDRYRRYGVKVTQIIQFRKGKAVAKDGKTVPEVGKQIDILLRDDSHLRAGAGAEARLTPGKTCVMILLGWREAALRDRPTYHTQRGLIHPSSPKGIEAAKNAADVTKWAWSKPRNGLQITILPSISSLAALHSKEGLWMDCRFAFRNASKEPVAVNLYKWDELFAVKAAGPKGRELTAKLIGRFDLPKPAKPFDKAHHATIKPGEVLFCDQLGRKGYLASFRLPMTDGKWKLTAIYATDREEKDLKLWTGRIDSAPVEVEVKNSPVKEQEE